MIIIDVETAGLDHGAELTQVAALDLGSDNQEVGAFDALVAFDEARADREALDLQGYDSASWKERAVPVRKALVDLAAWLKDRATVTRISPRTGNAYRVAACAAYNASFDADALMHWSRSAGRVFLPFDLPLRCLMQLARWTLPEEPGVSWKAEDVARRLGITTTQTHKALDDVRLEAAIYRELLRVLAKRERDAA